MHVTRVEIQNIRSLEQVTIELTPEEAPGWHVFIGSNASGKTTVLRSIALGLIGSSGVYALRENWKSWVRLGFNNGSIESKFILDEKDQAIHDNGVVNFIFLVMAVSIWLYRNLTN